MADHSVGGSSYNTPISRRTDRPHRSSGVDSHFESFKSSVIPESDRNELVASLMEELKETRNRENNLKRINNALSKALQVGSNPTDSQLQVAALASESEAKQKMAFTETASTTLIGLPDNKSKDSEVGPSSEPAGNPMKESLRSNISNASARSQREKSVRCMKELVEDIRQERDSLYSYRASKENTRVIDYSAKKMFGWTMQPSELAVSKRQPESTLNSLMMQLVSQKVELQTKTKQVETELRQGGLSRKERQLLEQSLRNLRRTAKHDQYQQYLKEKLVKEIDRYSTRLVLTARHTNR